MLTRGWSVMKGLGDSLEAAAGPFQEQPRGPRGLRKTLIRPSAKERAMWACHGAAGTRTFPGQGALASLDLATPASEEVAKTRPHPHLHDPQGGARIAPAGSAGRQSWRSVGSGRRCTRNEPAPRGGQARAGRGLEGQPGDPRGVAQQLDVTADTGGLGPQPPRKSQTLGPSGGLQGEETGDPASQCHPLVVTRTNPPGGQADVQHSTEGQAQASLSGAASC